MINDSGKREFKTLGDYGLVLDYKRFDAAKKDAQAWFDHMGAGGTNSSATVKDICQRYVDALTADGKQDAAVDTARRFACYVLDNPKFAQINIAKLTHDQVLAWRKRLVARPIDAGARRGELRSQSSLNRDMTPFRAALNLALADGFVTTALSWKKALVPIEGADKQRDVYLDLNQRRKLADCADDDLKAFIRAAMMLPIRPGALAALTVGDLDKRRSTLHIGKDKTGARSIGLPPDTLAYLLTQAANKLPAAPLLSRADGSAWHKDSWKKPFKTAAQLAGLDGNITAYALRHSTITDLVNAGFDLLRVGQLSGTSQRMIEQHYGHLVPSRGADALKTLTL